MKALEQRRGSTGVAWAGIWEPNKTYDEGSLVTRSGGLWLALKDTGNAPGKDLMRAVFELRTEIIELLRSERILR